MTIVVVNDKDQLKRALQSDATEIIVENEELVAQLRLIKRIRRAGPFVVAGVIASIALIPLSGGTSAVVGANVLRFATATYTAGAATTTSGLGLTSLILAIGGTIVIGIFTDWEEVEIAGLFKLKRKTKQSAK